MPAETSSAKNELEFKSKQSGIPRMVEDADLIWPPIKPKGPLPAPEPLPPKSSKPSKMSKKQNPVAKERTFACAHCSKAFFRKHDLERHARVHSGDRPYVCRVCHKGFPRNDALRRHIRLERNTHQSYFPFKDSDVLVMIERDPSFKDS